MSNHMLHAVFDMDMNRFCRLTEKSRKDWADNFGETMFVNMKVGVGTSVSGKAQNIMFLIGEIAGHGEDCLLSVRDITYSDIQPEARPEEEGEVPTLRDRIYPEIQS